jgi:hypothetical protein
MVFDVIDGCIIHCYYVGARICFDCYVVKCYVIFYVEIVDGGIGELDCVVGIVGSIYFVDDCKGDIFCSYILVECVFY